MRLSTPHGHHFFHDHGFFLGQHYHDEAGLHRGWLGAIGALFLVLGLVGLSRLFLMTVASVLFFGALAFVGGIVQLAQAFTSHGRRNVLTGALFGVLYLVAAVLIFNNPLASSLVLTIFLACALIALGVARIAFSLQHRHNRYWNWSVVSGALSLVIGFLILLQWPVTGLTMIGLFVSLELIFHGVAALALAMEHTSAV